MLPNDGSPLYVLVQGRYATVEDASISFKKGDRDKYGDQDKCSGDDGRNATDG